MRPRRPRSRRAGRSTRCSWRTRTCARTCRPRRSRRCSIPRATPGCVANSPSAARRTHARSPAASRRAVTVDSTLRERLDTAGVRWVRIVWCDHAGVIRAKAAHRRLLDDGLPDGVGMTVAQQALPVTVYAATGSMNLHQAFIAELTAALEALGLEPEFYYPESAPGQQEISIRHAEPLAAADRQITYREAVRGVAARHGYVASFLPKVHESVAGSGSHLNVSLWRAGESVMADARHPTGLSETARRFIAGVLDHVRGLAAITVPSRNSYRRLQPHFWAGAFAVWGYDNREAAIRVTRGATRFELKTCDATSNPYLALGALIAAGLDGVRRALELPRDVAVDPGHYSDDERRRRGIEPLPRSLGEALEALAADKTLCESLGSARARAYLAVKRMEWEALRDLALADEVAMLAERY